MESFPPSAVHAAPTAPNEAVESVRPSLQSQRPASDDELTRRCLLDTAERSATGVWIYPAVWMALAVATGVSARWPQWVWSNVVGLLAMAVARTVLNRNLASLLEGQHRVLAAAVFKLLTLAIAAYWGTLTGLCMMRATGEGFTWIMLTVTVGFCTGGNTMFGINPALRFAYPLAMMGPVVLAQALHPTLEHKVLMVIEVVFALYLRRASGIVQKDYWDARLAQRLSAQQARELELASLTDGLTQVPNRLYFDRQLAYEWARQCRHGGPVSLMLVDLDHFKRVNDTHGHPFGDECLKAVARALIAGCGRSTDFVARYGGEEFVVLLAETDAQGARVVAERMLAQVRGIALAVQGHPVPLSCSIGLCTMVPSRSKEAACLLHNADKALYSAKHAGRDQEDHRLINSLQPQKNETETRNINVTKERGADQAGTSS
jgi:diguanylate cyclase (GGDEF)-like protein